MAITAFYFLYEIDITNFLNPVLIFTLEVFILCKKVMEPRGSGARIGGMNFDIPWNFVKEHVLHNFMKYFFVARIVNCLVLAICHFKLRKKWCLQNFYSIKKWMMLEIVDKNASKIMTLPSNLVLIWRL